MLCADSEECYGEYKTSVTKIKPQRLADGLYQVAFGGSGLSDLVDGLNDKLEQGLNTCRGRTELELRAAIEKIIVEFYKSDPVSTYQCDPNDANLSGVVCVRVVPKESVFLFKFSRTIVLPVRDYVVRGLEIPVYERIAKRLYHPRLLPLHAQLIGLRVLSEAESTSTLVDSPFTTVFAMTHGMFASDRNTDLYVKALLNVQREMDDLLLSCADTHAISNAEAKLKLTTFRRTILELRRNHQRLLAQDFQKQLREVKRPAKERK